jgi:hypothetical protein
MVMTRAMSSNSPTRIPASATRKVATVAMRGSLSGPKPRPRKRGATPSTASAWR